MTDFRSIRWANDQEHIASRFQQYHRVMNHWKEVLPVPIQEVNYEDTVTDLESAARRLVGGVRPWIGNRRAWSSIARSGPFAPPASCRSASRFISGRSRAGKTTSRRWPSSSPLCRGMGSPSFSIGNSIAMVYGCVAVKPPGVRCGRFAVS